METAIEILNTVAPVFCIIAVGYAVAGLSWLDARSLGNLAVMITAPCLIFRLLATTSLAPGRLGTLFLGGVWMAAGTGLLAVLYARKSGAHLRGLMMPAMFWNAGNMALPIAERAFGEEGLHMAAILFVTVTSLQATVGIAIAKGRGGLREVFRVPLLYAALAGLFVAAAGARVHPLLLAPVTLLGDVTIPLMLLNLGIQLRRLGLQDLRHASAAVAIRMGGGCLAMLLFVGLFAPDDLERKILLLGAVMPPAVINVLFAQRYGTAPGLVASSIVLGTLLSVVAIPLMLWWLGV